MWKILEIDETGLCSARGELVMPTSSWIKQECMPELTGSPWVDEPMMLEILTRRIGEIKQLSQTAARLGAVA